MNISTTKIYRAFLPIVMSIMLFSSPLALASTDEENYVRLRIFFGLSQPDGGAVSLKDWQNFEIGTIAKEFPGFNVVDSVGYYLGEPERSKVVTVILKESEMAKAKKVAKEYAKEFKQNSVMIVKIPVEEWIFVGAD